MKYNLITSRSNNFLDMSKLFQEQVENDMSENYSSKVKFQKVD